MTDTSLWTLLLRILALPILVLLAAVWVKRTARLNNFDKGVMGILLVLTAVVCWRYGIHL